MSHSETCHGWYGNYPPKMDENLCDCRHPTYDLKWWAYIHVNGSIQLKRYFDVRDLTEAAESPFVKDIIQPFDAFDREAALAHVKQVMGIA